MPRLRRSSVVLAVGLLAFALVGAAADPLETVRAAIQQTLPHAELDLLFTTLEWRAPGRGPVKPRGFTIYEQRVSGVVLIATRKALGTGVLVSDQGDIITNDHVVEGAHSEQGHEWVPVWFKPPPGERATAAKFLIGRIVQRSAQHDLAHIRVDKGLPANAKVVPMATAPPIVGQDVFTIGHPPRELWSFGEGKVAQVRPHHQWKYGNGGQRSATTIQTEARVDPGSSGGPLLNGDGTIVGIVVGSAAAQQNVYYAVSVQHVHDLLRP